MLFTFYVSAPANTTRTNASKYNLKVRAGVLTKVEVLIPDGHHALGHLVILDGNTPFIPEEGELGILGDRYVAVWTGWKEIKDDPYKLLAEVWNDDDTYLHGFYIYMTILPQWLANPMGKLIELLSNLLERFRIVRV